jgi:SpoIVB peptidase S55
VSSRGTHGLGLFASGHSRAYHNCFMLAPTTRLYALLLAVCLLLGSVLPARAADGPALLPLSDVKPGMKGVAYTIFQGDQVEKVDLEVIGILNNAVGPKQDVILVRLLGDKVLETGVVAGMSGSPVYIDGKLVGALALKLGAFTKEAIGGVTPIENMLEVEHLPASPAPAASGLPPSAPAKDATGVLPLAALIPGAYGTSIPLPDEFAQQVDAGSGQMLVPIETPLVAAGLYPQTLAYFGRQFASWGMTVMAGGTVPPSPEDAQLKPGDMVGFDLIRGDLSLSSGCTVTTVDGPLILACGHSLFGFGRVEVPLSRAHVLMTLASSQASTKIITTSGTIGTLTQDRQTAVMGKLGAGPPMIPVDVTLETPSVKKKYHFEVIESPQLAPTLVATAVYNGIIGSPVYGEGSTLELDGTIDVQGHTPVQLEDLFAPTDQPVPAGFFVATDVQSAFSLIYSNPYEVPQIKRVDLQVKTLADRRWATIDNAWVEKSEVHPGETVAVKVLLRPYRGEPFIQEIPVTIPPQAARGTLELAVSDAEFLNRNVQLLTATSQGQLAGLEELIQLLNRERHNDRLYATLLQPTPTMLVEDKEMPNVPASAINVFDERRNLGDARLLWQSTVGEWSVEMHQLIAGQRMLAITVK